MADVFMTSGASQARGLIHHVAALALHVPVTFLIYNLFLLSGNALSAKRLTEPWGSDGLLN